MALKEGSVKHSQGICAFFILYYYSGGSLKSILIYYCAPIVIILFDWSIEMNEFNPNLIKIMSTQT